MTVENIVCVIVGVFTLAVIGNIWFKWISSFDTLATAVFACCCSALIGILFHSVSTTACCVAMLVGAIGGAILWHIIPTFVKKIIYSILGGGFVVLLVIAAIHFVNS